MRDVDNRTREFIDSHRVARLATVDGSGRPTVLPICYAFDGKRFYSAIDEKPKTVSSARLKRLRNIQANPQVSLVIDDYSEEWTQLRYVLVRGAADVLEPGGIDASQHAKAVELLREKYAQYRTMAIDQQPVIRIEVTTLKGWSGRKD